jgi:hypothetical protein
MTPVIRDHAPAEGHAQSLGNRRLHAAESTWEETVEREIRGTETRLQRRLDDYDKVLEMLMQGIPDSTVLKG